ncbi:MAG: deoxyribonuclease IV [Deltaproteobacteria bacterium]|nr:deoxyribonuclease IV [Deltaproteobacteria bacterium]
MSENINLGVHASTTGGIHNSIHEGTRLSCGAIQVFTANQMQWLPRELKKEEIKLYHEALKGSGIRWIVSHTSYLLNLASEDDSLWKKTIGNLIQEIERCEILEIPYTVMHPGSHKGAGMDKGVRRIIKGINTLFEMTNNSAVELLLETTAGQGTNIGFEPEQIGAIIGGIHDYNRIGVCIDTCHLFAAGVLSKDPDRLDECLERLDRAFGLDKIKVVHVNDSKKDFGSRVDRHEHIGKGMIGLPLFRAILRNGFLSKLPLILETPKTGDMDKINLKVLRDLLR